MSNHIIASEGDTISLPCPLVSSIMGDDIFWKRFLNAEELPLPSISSGGNMKLPYLMLTAVRWFDLGIYECHVISEGKAMVHFINLTVITSKSRMHEDVYLSSVLFAFFQRQSAFATC